MAARLEHETFSQHLNTKFRILVNETDAVEVELSHVGELLLSPRQERFAITFRGPREFVLPQGPYKFEHAEMGEFTLFLVAIGQDDKGTNYEAVFNRLPKPQ